MPRKTAPGIPLLLYLLFQFTGCGLEKPSAPSWDVPVNVPLINKDFTMAEIAEDETVLDVDSTGLIRFELEADLDHYYVGDQLTLDDVSEPMALEVGIFTVASPGTELTYVELREIFPDAETFHGQSVVVPPFTFVTEPKLLDPYENYSYALIEEGSVSINLINNLAVPLGTPLNIEVRHAQLDTLIGTAAVAARIPAGQSAMAVMDLAGKRVPNRLAVRVSGDSPGSEGQVVTVDAGSSFEIEAEISELEVREALARIPSQIVDLEKEATITDSVVVSHADVQEGRIELSITEGLPVDAWITYVLPDFGTPTGSVLSDSSYVARQTNFSNTIDLSGYVLEPAMADFGDQRVRVLWTLRTLDSGSEEIYLRSTDMFDADFAVRDVIFSTVSGKLGATDVDIEQSEMSFEIPAGVSDVLFETAELELVIDNRINFPVATDFRVEGRNDAGATSEMMIREPVGPALQPGMTSTTTILLDQRNSTINDFIRIVPEFVGVFGQVKVGDESWVGTVTKDDFITGRVRITAPAVFSITPQDVELEADTLSIEEDIRNDVIENLSSGGLFVKINNHLPLGAAVEFLFGNSKESTFSDPILRLGPVSAETGIYDASGLVSEGKITESSITLTGEQIQMFRIDPLFAGVRVSLQGTEGQTVKVRSTDFIRVQAYSNMNLRVNQDD